MWRVALFLLCLSLTIASGLTTPVHAVTTSPETVKNKGLYITPLRSYVSLNANEEVTRALTVANLTDKQITVKLSVEEFSVTDYTYDYRFGEPDKDWLRFVKNELVLKPYQSYDAAYRISIPRGGAPGGYYYTLFASADLSPEKSEGTVRAASLVYLTVNGAVRRTATLNESNSPFLILSPQIPYSVDLKNTGNIHYFAYFSATVDGLFYHNEPNGTSQLLMPGTSRKIKNTISSPFIPGIYKLTYGYAPDQADPVKLSHYILVLPPWFIAFSLVIIYTAFRLWRKRIRTHKAEAVIPTDS
jgi:hypothetical protein